MARRERGATDPSFRRSLVLPGARLALTASPPHSSLPHLSLCADTSTGPILIAVNPFQRMEHLYSKEVMERYRRQGEGLGSSVVGTSAITPFKSGNNKILKVSNLFFFIQFSRYIFL